jgi:hypothetical protein
MLLRFIVYVQVFQEVIENAAVYIRKLIASAKSWFKHERSAL